VANQSTPNKQRVPLSFVELYYKNLLIYFDAIALFNQVRPLYELLDEDWMPDALKLVYSRKYNSNPEQVRDAYAKYRADIKVDWNKVENSLKCLNLPYTEEQIREFRGMAEATEEQSDFRSRVRGRVDRQCKNAQKEILRRRQGLEPKPIYVDTPRKLLEWFRKPRRTRKKA
jgi:hypothetical protein